jgi:enoyl-CoA hydratase/carnithine racemase
MAVFSRLDEILDRVARDEELRVLIVTGAGNAFLSGADINELFHLDNTSGWSASRFQQSVFHKL